MLFRSLLSINQCVSALTAAIDKEPLFAVNWGGRHPVVGTIRRREFKIRKRPTLPYFRNQFTPIFLGAFREEMTGTLIEGRFGFHPIEMGFLIVWFVGVFGLVGPFSYGAGIPVFFWLFFVISAGFTVLPLLLGLRDRQYLQDFLERTLKAYRVDVNNGEL